jgi:hypothetical protein
MAGRDGFPLWTEANRDKEKERWSAASNAAGGVNAAFTIAAGRARHGTYLTAGNALLGNHCQDFHHNLPAAGRE